MDDSEKLIRALEIMGLFSKARDVSAAVGECGTDIFGAMEGQERRRAVLEAIRPFMDDNKQREIDIIMRFMLIKELIDELKILLYEPAGFTERGFGNVV